MSMIDNPKAAQDFLNNAVWVMLERAKEYDSPGGERSMEATVEMFNAATGLEITESHGWFFMECLKNVRQFSAKGFHLDSAIDGTAYSALKNEALKREHDMAILGNPPGDE